MHDAVAFYNVNDNDNQANSNDDLAAETKNKNPEEEKRQRGESPEWRRRKKKTQRNTTATTTSTRIYATEWIEAKKKKIKRKRKCAEGFLCITIVQHYFSIFFFCVRLLYEWMSVLRWLVVLRWLDTEPRETIRNSRNPKEKGQTLEEKTSKHPAYSQITSTHKRKEKKNTSTRRIHIDGDERMNETNIKWIYILMQELKRKRAVYRGHEAMCWVES